jgi:hypothetical protein
VPAGASAQPAAIVTPSSAPAYCLTLSASPSIRGLSAAMQRLAQAPKDPAAHATIRDAAATLNAAANRAPGPPRSALLDAATAIRTLDQRGLSAAPNVNAALQRAGQTLEGPCSFPVG